MLKIIPILLGIVISYIVALVTGNVDFSAGLRGGFVGLPPFMLAKFNVSAIIIMVPIALATMMEHIGDIAAIGATCERNFLANPGLHRTLLGDGLATSLAGLVGGPANTTYGENTGVLALTKVYDPIVMEIAAVVAVLLSFIPKFGEVVNSIPTAIIGGISFILYGSISAIGVRNVVENQVDLTQSRNLLIAAGYPRQRPRLQLGGRHYLPHRRSSHHAERPCDRGSSRHPDERDPSRKRLCFQRGRVCRRCCGSVIETEFPVCEILLHFSANLQKSGLGGSFR